MSSANPPPNLPVPVAADAGSAAEPAPAALHRVEIEPGGWRFAAPADMSLLLAARAAGVILPSSCRNGTCRACICSLASGSITYSIEWPGLSAEEKAAGWILPCVARPCSDLRLTAPQAHLAAPPR
jgi:ferredoxin